MALIEHGASACTCIRARPSTAAGRAAGLALCSTFQLVSCQKGTRALRRGLIRASLHHLQAEGWHTLLFFLILGERDLGSVKLYNGHALRGDHAGLGADERRRLCGEATQSVGP